MVCIGGLDPHFLAISSPAIVEKMALEILELMEGKENFIFSTADDVVYGTPVENLTAVSRIVTVV